MRAQVATPEASWKIAGGKPAPAGAATGMFPQNIVRTLARVPEESPSVAIMHSRFSRISIVTGVGWGEFWLRPEAALRPFGLGRLPPVLNIVGSTDVSRRPVLY